MKKPLPGGGKDFLLGGCPGSKLEEYCGLTQLKHCWKNQKFLYIQSMLTAMQQSAHPEAHKQAPRHIDLKPSAV